MPELRPFPGVRYTSSDHLAELVCPPYDVIPPQEQQRLHDLHEHNAIRLELARPQPGDNKYGHVGETFKRWIDEGVLRADEEEAFYVYRQDFTDPGGKECRVTGVIGALELEPFGAASGVLPHERTMPGPKEDRLQLMRACPANISPIYAIYRGQGALRDLYSTLESRTPVTDFADAEGIRHRFWIVTEPADVKTIAETVRPGPLVIADGHHRYETALAFHTEQGSSPGDHGSIMCFCVDADSEELCVLPYHRALKSEIPAEDTTTRLFENFSARPADVERWTEEVSGTGADHPFVVVAEAGASVAFVTDEQVIEAAGDRHPAWRALDVVALHEVLIPEVYGAPGELTFTRDANEIVSLVRAKEWDAGFLLRALSATQVVDVAGSGERMPQKASYFWPKALTGLVFHALD